MKQVPDVVGFSAIDGCEMILAAGLVPYGPGLEPPPTDGVVVRQQPEAFSNAQAGDPVVLEVQSPHDATAGAPSPELATETV